MDELPGFGSMVLEGVVFEVGEHAKTSNNKTTAGNNFLIQPSTNRSSRHPAGTSRGPAPSRNEMVKDVEMFRFGVESF